MEWTLEKIEKLTKIAIEKRACESNLNKAKEAVTNGDIETWLAIARGNVGWVAKFLKTSSEKLGDGPMLVYHDNGLLYKKGYLKNRQLHGLCYTYYKNGSLCIAAYYQNGINHGRYKGFYRDGSLCAELFYSNGELHGPYRIYYEDGQLQEEGYYQNAEYHGLCTEFNESGTCRRKIYYENGVCIKQFNCKKEK